MSPVTGGVWGRDCLRLVVFVQIRQAISSDHIQGNFWSCAAVVVASSAVLFGLQVYQF